MVVIVASKRANSPMAVLIGGKHDGHVLADPPHNLLEIQVPAQFSQGFSPEITVYVRTAEVDHEGRVVWRPKSGV